MKPIIQRFSTEWPPEVPPLFGKEANLVGIGDIPRILSKSDLERSWKEFVGWIGFSELVKSVKRKELSINQTSLRLLAEEIFSIEIGLSRILKRWSTFRRLLYPKDSSIYNAYSFVQTCMALKKELQEIEADNLRKRVIGNLLPSGRLLTALLEAATTTPHSNRFLPSVTPSENARLRGRETRHPPGIVPTRRLGSGLDNLPSSPRVHAGDQETGQSWASEHTDLTYQQIIDGQLEETCSEAGDIFDQSSHALRGPPQLLRRASLMYHLD
jgi:hypothetical protein